MMSDIMSENSISSRQPSAAVRAHRSSSSPLTNRTWTWEFAAGPDAAGRQRASEFLRKHKRQIRDSICQWTNEKKYRVNKLLNRLIDRCDQLGLYVRPADSIVNLQVASYITTLVMNYLFTGKFKRSK